MLLKDAVVANSILNKSSQRTFILFHKDFMSDRKLISIDIKDLLIDHQKEYRRSCITKMKMPED